MKKLFTYFLVFLLFSSALKAQWQSNDPNAPCFAPAGLSDKDNDGVPDECDLDDDNDGILDLDECFFSPCGGQVLTGFTQNLDTREVHLTENCDYFGIDGCDTPFFPSIEVISSIIEDFNGAVNCSGNPAMNISNSSASGTPSCTTANNTRPSTGTTNLLSELFTGTDIYGLPDLPVNNYQGQNVTAVSSCNINNFVASDLATTSNCGTVDPNGILGTDWIIVEGYVLFPPTPTGSVPIRTSNQGPDDLFRRNYYAFMISCNADPAGLSFIGEAQTEGAIPANIDIDIPVATGATPAQPTLCTEPRYFRLYIFDNHSGYAASISWSLDGGATYTQIPSQFLSTTNPFDAVSTLCDTDGDGIEDAQDLDSDNDGIPDAIEACGNINLTLDQCSLDFDGDGGYSAIDANGCPTGEVDLAECYGAPNDTDGNGTPDYIDLDSDGDGCYDNQEALTDDFGTSTDTYLPGDGTTTTTDDCGLLLNTISGNCPIPIDNGWIEDTTEAITCPADITVSGADENAITTANSDYAFSGTATNITNFPVANFTTEFDVVCAAGNPTFGVCSYSVTYQDAVMDGVGCDLTMERTFSLITNCNTTTCVQTITVISPKSANAGSLNGGN